MNKKYITEIFWLRAIACLAVVMIHSITKNRLEHPESEMLFSLELFQVSLMFATPVFVFISEFLISHNYKGELPKGFFKKRAKFLLTPYIFMGFLFALVFNDNLTLYTFLFKGFTNVFLGLYVGYFILIIFQFYILHHFLHKKLAVWNPWKVLSITFFISFFYILFFNFVPIPDSLLAEYIWKRGYWLIFIGWLFYFALGYYTGKHFELIKQFVIRHSFVIIFSTLITLAFLLTIHYSGLFTYTASKRFDMMLYTTAMIFMIILISSKFKKTPRIIIFISNYSFSIFLLHRFTVSTIGSYSDNDIVNILIKFVVGVVASIVLSYLINLLPFGKYLVGQPYKKKS